MRQPEHLSRRQLLTALIGVGIGNGGDSRAVAGLPPRRRVYDALLHRNKPDLRRYGLTPLPTLYNIWPNGVFQPDLDVALYTEAVQALPADAELFFIDIENWPVYPVADAVRAASIAKLQEAIALSRAMRPGIRLGIYSLPPVSTYWAIVLHDPTLYPAWRRANEALSPLAAAVDVLFPSLYTFYDDPTGWMKAAMEILTAARDYRKPVYPFLWFQYHDSNPTLTGHDLPGDAWSREMQFCLDNADGFVIWGGAGQEWDPKAQWWARTRALLRGQGFV